MGTIIGEGITFDDVLLVPAYSKVIPNQVDIAINRNELEPTIMKSLKFSGFFIYPKSSS